MKIPLCKASIDKHEIKRIAKSLTSPWLTTGPYNLEFEKKFKNKLKTNYAVSMNSCTSALECAVLCLGIKGEIIIPSFTWLSTANSIINSGCTPVFADVELNSRNIDPQDIIKKITKKTIAIMIVHFGGLPCDMDKILSICKKYKLKLIEDSAETLGATFKGKYTGSFGMGCFSFYPTKNITTTEGGMLTLKNKNEYEKAKKIAAHGLRNKKIFFWNREGDLAGHNFRMPNHLAVLGISQLAKLDKFNFKRRKIAKKYDLELLKLSELIIIQKIPKNFTHSYQMYTFRISKKYRNNLLMFMRSKNIEATAHFDPPLHQQKYLKDFLKGKLPNTDILSKEIITLPIYPDMSNKEILFVIDNIKKFISKIKIKKTNF